MEVMIAMPAHPHIVRYIDSFTNDDKFSIVMEYCERGDLSNYLRRVTAPPLKMEIPELKVWRFFIQMCLGLDHMHNHCIVHSDLKPANILLYGKDCSVKLADFGTS